MIGLIKSDPTTSKCYPNICFLFWCFSCKRVWRTRFTV